ncbi:MAG: TadE/TadG family type IV pilus assembly protein [Acidimicrobiales bacterium]
MTRFRQLRRSDDSGTAVLETLLVAPVFFLLVLGIFEFGLIYRDVLTTSDAAANAARRGAVLGPRIPASGVAGDFEIIREVRNSLGSISVESVDRIVIFRASAPGAGSPESQVPAGCKSGDSVPGVCNVYDPANAFLAVDIGDNDYFACPGGRSCAWPSSARSDGPTPSDVDYLGVWIRLERPYVTGLFGDVFTFERASIVRLEAGKFEE